MSDRSMHLIATLSKLQIKTTANSRGQARRRMLLLRWTISSHPRSSASCISATVCRCRSQPSPSLMYGKRSRCQSGVESTNVPRRSTPRPRASVDPYIRSPDEALESLCLHFEKNFSIKVFNSFLSKHSRYHGGRRCSKDLQGSRVSEAMIGAVCIEPRLHLAGVLECC